MLPIPIRRALVEPLVQFALVGIVLFGVDRVRHGASAPSSKAATIRVGAGDASIARHLVVDDSIRARLRTSFEQAQGRAPTPAELDYVVSQWVTEEILYREALARQLDRGDDRVRSVLGSKMRFVLESEAVVTEPSDADVRAYFDANAKRWAKDEAFDFVHVFVHGDDTAADTKATELLAALERGEEPGRLGDTFSGGRRYRRRSLGELRESFGEAFIEGLAAQKTGTWHKRRSRFGIHLVRIEGRAPADAPAFADVRADVLRQLVEERKAALVDKRITELRARWDVVGAPR